jgi:hypothetical protein
MQTAGIHLSLMTGGLSICCFAAWRFSITGEKTNVALARVEIGTRTGSGIDDPKTRISAHGRAQEAQSTGISRYGDRRGSVHRVLARHAHVAGRRAAARATRRTGAKHEASAGPTSFYPSRERARHRREARRIALECGNPKSGPGVGQSSLFTLAFDNLSVYLRSYQRYYTGVGVKYNHIINPDT